MMNLTLTVSLDAPNWHKEVDELAESALRYFLAEQKIKAQENKLPILPLRILVDEGFAIELFERVRGIIVARQFITGSSVQEVTLTVEMACVQAEAVSLSGHYMCPSPTLSMPQKELPFNGGEKHYYTQGDEITTTYVNGQLTTTAYSFTPKGYNVPVPIWDANGKPLQGYPELPVQPGDPCAEDQTKWGIVERFSPEKMQRAKDICRGRIEIGDDSTAWEIRMQALQCEMDNFLGHTSSGVTFEEESTVTQPLTSNPPQGRSAIECLGEGPGEIYHDTFTIILTDLGSYRVIDCGYQVFCALSLEELREYEDRCWHANEDTAFRLEAEVWRRGNV